MKPSDIVMSLINNKKMQIFNIQNCTHKNKIKIKIRALHTHKKHCVLEYRVFGWLIKLDVSEKESIFAEVYHKT